MSIIIGYIIWTLITFSGAIYIILDNCIIIKNTFVSDNLDDYNLNFIGRICITLVIYILFPGLLIIDLGCLFRIIFTWHPEPKQKKIKQLQVDMLNERIDSLMIEHESMKREINREIQNIKETLFVEM